jgi:hypothetical protein
MAASLDLPGVVMMEVEEAARRLLERRLRKW